VVAACGGGALGDDNLELSEVIHDAPRFGLTLFWSTEPDPLFLRSKPDLFEVWVGSGVEGAAPSPGCEGSCFEVEGESLGGTCGASL